MGYYLMIAEKLFLFYNFIENSWNNATKLKTQVYIPKGGWCYTAKTVLIIIISLKKKNWGNKMKIEKI